MNILIVSAEASPFAKTGGLADAVSGLGRALALKGNSVKILIPRYYCISKDSLELCKSALLVSTGWSEITVNVYRAMNSVFYESGSLEYIFIDNEKLYGRDGIYGSDYEPDYHDNPLRFSVLSRSAFAFCRSINWIPDIIHSNDWSTALVPVILNLVERKNFPHTKTVFTIHNLGYQGSYPDAAYRLLGLPESCKYDCHLARFGGINLLQAGICSSDFITTVSKKFMEEAMTPLGGFGLDGILRGMSDVFEGIVNGADSTEWNPLTDRYIPAHYSKDDLTGKRICREALQKTFGLKTDSDVPVIGIICRLVEQKGIAELFAPYYGAMYRMCSDFNAQFVVVGSGEKWCENEIHSLTGRFENFGSYIGYSEKISHIVEAGSDLFLMPSKYEPCGLNQIYSMLYGTIPVVRATGGLDDTVISWAENPDKATGFKFYDLTPDAVYNTVKWALSVFEDKAAVRKMQHNGMSSDFSWSASAEKYISIYKKLLSE